MVTFQQLKQLFIITKWAWKYISVGSWKGAMTSQNLNFNEDEIPRPKPVSNVVKSHIHICCVHVQLT